MGSKVIDWRVDSTYLAGATETWQILIGNLL